MDLKKINDLNVHPVELQNTLSKTIELDKKINSIKIENFLKKNLFYSKINIMIMNEKIISNYNEVKKIEKIKKKYKNIEFTYLVNFNNYRKTIAVLKNYKHIKRIKFHSYFQKISKKNYKNIIKICKFAEKKNISILVDASYGTLMMNKYNNIDLIISIANEIKKTPIIILHSGGININKALLIAVMQNNIFLETSFTMTWFKGSRIWDDLSFAYKKIGFDKIIYASDSPYVKKEISLRDFLKFSKKYKISKVNLNKILKTNYLKV